MGRGRTKREVILLQHKIAETVGTHPDIRRDDIAALIGVNTKPLYGYLCKLKQAGVLTSRYVGHYRIGDTTKLRPIPDPKPTAADKAQKRERTKREREALKKRILDALDEHGAMSPKELAVSQSMDLRKAFYYLHTLLKDGKVQRYGQLYLLAGEKLPPKARPVRVAEPIAVPLAKLMAGK